MLVLPSAVADICDVLQRRGHQAYLVGGAVRDYLQAKQWHRADLEIHDYDIATSATPEQVISIFPRTVPTGLKHGTVTVLHGLMSIEVTTFRSDQGYSDGRHPDDVVFVKTIEEDLARRDFTINAMAFDPIKEAIIDPFTGQFDLEHRIINCVGDPVVRFQEDGLRLMRAIRFISTLGFTLETRTMEAITECAHLIDSISQERIRDELMKLLMGRGAQDALELLVETKLLPRILPELVPQIGQVQNRHHKWDVWTHTLKTVGLSRHEPMLRLAALLHDVGKPASAEPATKEWLEGSPSAPVEFTFYDHDKKGEELARQIMNRLKFSNDEIKHVTTLVRYHMGAFHLGAHPTGSALRRFIRRVGPDYLNELFELFRADAYGAGTKTNADSELLGLRAKIDHELLRPNAITKSRDLAINGHDVMVALGIAPGPEVGRLLKVLEEKCLDDPELNTREKLLALLPQEF